MKFGSFKPLPLTAAIGSILAVASISATSVLAGPVISNGITAPQGPSDPHTVLNNGPASYIIRFVEAPLGQFEGGPGVASVPRTADGRLEVKSPQAVAYVSKLQSLQQQRIAAIEQQIQRPLVVRFQMQYALNAVVTMLTPAEAAKIGKAPGVAEVVRDRSHAPATDIGPGFIGAKNLWFGENVPADTIFFSGFETPPSGFRGEGIVVGDIDTGYNSKSPSFAATDSSGYSITNPLGSGNFLGQCNVPNISLGGCNNKVIGVYDLVDAAAPFSVEDTQGHGSHTASTAVGNIRSANYHGYEATISGVAPRSNLVVFYVCSPDPAVQCQESSTAMAVEHALQDGVVNALNYSISGGTDPWGDIASQAFLSASNAGIFIAAAGGNTSASVPAAIPGTVNHWEPWVATLAASTHTGGAIAPDFSMTGPGTPPANTQNIPLDEAQADTPSTATIPGTTPVKLSPNFHNTDLTGTDGCSAYPAGTFTNAIALISRGTCAYGTKVGNAVTAGAIAVLISDNRPEAPIGITLGTPVQPIPAYSIVQSDGTNLASFLGAKSGATGTIPYPPSRQPQQPDVLAGFSLLGPAGIDVIKPDLEAPGVDILAAVANDGTANGPNLVDLYNGTSMATPHTTGSGALLLGLHPNWTPAEVKSALMMTAKESDVTKPDGITPADFYDRGSGRIQVDIASAAGLVLGETAQNYKLANPAATPPGDPSTLNIASMQSSHCFTATASSCTFVRTFRSTSSTPTTWQTSVTGALAGDVTVTPASFTTSSAQDFQTLHITVDSSSLNADGNFNFGELVLTPSSATPHPLHLPISVAVPAPTLDVEPQLVNLSLGANATASGNFTVFNRGGPTLDWHVDTSGDTQQYLVINQPSNNNNGYFSTRFTDQGNTGFYASDDFTVTGFANADLGVIVTPGFGVGSAMSTYPGTTPLHVRVFADAGGMPAGNPESGAAPVWSYDTTFAGADVFLAGDTFVVFPTTASQLPPGHYWLVVYPDLKCAAGSSGCTKGWAWFLSTTNSGDVGQTIVPSAAPPNNTWTPIVEGTGFAMTIGSNAACSALPWLMANPTSGALAGLGSEPVTATAIAAQMASTSITGYLCIAGSDGNTIPVQVNATKQ
jgi:hypothetical protein